MERNNSTAIYALTPQGAELALRVCAVLSVLPQKQQTDIFIPIALKAPTLPPEKGAVHTFSRLQNTVAQTFARYDAHIFIAATGIAVRTIAPYIVHKATDPAILVIDQRGQFVISLLSGHLGGANSLTKAIAAGLDATAIITTATDVEGLPAIDSLAAEKGLQLYNLSAVKHVSAALIAGSTIPLYDPDDWLGLHTSSHAHNFQFLNVLPELTPQPVPHIVLAEREITLPSDSAPWQDENSPAAGKLFSPLIIYPPLYAVGVGCKRGTSAETLLVQIRHCCAISKISLLSLFCLASVTLKQDEKGLFDVAEKLGLPVHFFSVEELQKYAVSHPSAKCEEVLGLKGVCEPAALAAAGHGATLAKTKEAGRGVTIAIAKKAVNHFMPDIS